MNEADKKLLKEALELVDKGLSRIADSDNEIVKNIAKLLHTAIMFGEVIL